MTKPSTVTVLALRALGLGDALTGVPALRGLRRAYPRHRLVLAGPASVGGWLAALGVVDHVVPATGLAPLQWDGPAPAVAVNLHGSGPQSHRLLQALQPGRLVGFACPAADFTDGPPWRDDLHEVERWCALVRAEGGACGPADLRLTLEQDGRGSGPATPYVLVHPGAAAGARRWPVDRWRAVVQHAAARAGVVVTGTPAEQQVTAAVSAADLATTDLTGRLDIAGLARVVAGASCVLSGDTGVAHLATALGVPSVTLFGPTSPAAWGPTIAPERHHVIWHPEVASPGNPLAAQPDPRLLAIGAAEVTAALDRALELTPSRPAADGRAGATGRQPVR